MKKFIIITGAASGIGAATVSKYLSNTDFSVLAIDVNQQGLDDLINSYPEQYQQRVKAISVDLTNYASVNETLIETVREIGGIHHIVISHAIGISNEVTENEKWDRILNVNLHATQRLLSMLAEYICDEGRVVVVSSVLGRAGKASNTGYVASKHALLGLVKALALDWASRKITVNSILPCWVDTPMLRSELKPQAEFLGLPMKQLLRQLKKRIPLRSLISSDDIADTVMFLASPAARMITAQSIVVDGGFGCGV